VRSGIFRLGVPPRTRKSNPRVSLSHLEAIRLAVFAMVPRPHPVALHDLIMRLSGLPPDQRA
jgi:hypothetical protein